MRSSLSTPRSAPAGGGVRVGESLCYLELIEGRDEFDVSRFEVDLAEEEKEDGENFGGDRSVSNARVSAENLDEDMFHEFHAAE